MKRATPRCATAVAHPNIALVKYWGKRDEAQNLPAVSSVSLTVEPFRTETTVEWGTSKDEVLLAGEPCPARFRARVLEHLSRIDANRPPCTVSTRNSFPSGAGLASSASGFAALTVAAAAAAGLDLEPTTLSRLARQGSGSACRSLWGGFVRWDRGEREDGSDSHGFPLPSPEAWDVVLVAAVVSRAEKAVSSTEGMRRTRDTSRFYEAFVGTSDGDVTAAVRAIEAQDLDALGRTMEASTFAMHAAMLASSPPLLYWQPATVACLNAVFALRERGIAAYATMDAGPQVKVLCRGQDAAVVAEALRPHALDVLVLRPGPGPSVRLGPSVLS